MISFLWHFPLGWMGNSRVFPEEFVLLPENAKVYPYALRGGEVWLIANVDSEGDFLFGRFVANGITEIDEGIDIGRYLIQVDPFRSFRILPHDEAQRHKWKLDGAVFSSGIYPCNQKHRSDFIKLLHSNVPRSFSAPHPAKVSGLKLPPGDFSPEEMGRELFRLALSRYTFGDLERWEKFKGSSPFAVLAVAKCREIQTPESAIKEILRLDSELTGTLSLTIDPGNLTTNEGSAAAEPSRIDILLVQIQASDILTRRYQDAALENGSVFSTEKTQMAEERHQEILKDIVEFTTRMGFLPLASRSIDVSFLLKDGLLLVEIKSATEENFLSQVEKGIIQIIKYDMAFEEENDPVSGRFLVLETIEETREMEFAQKLGKRLGVTLDFYHRNRPWPHRLEKLIEFLYRQNG